MQYYNSINNVYYKILFAWFISDTSFMPQAANQCSLAAVYLEANNARIDWNIYCDKFIKKSIEVANFQQDEASEAVC